MKKIFCMILIVTLSLATIVMAIGGPENENTQTPTNDTTPANTEVLLLSDETTPLSSLMTNMTTSSTFSPAKSFLKNGNNIVKTETGAFMVYVEREDIIALKAHGKLNALNQFTLHALDEETGATTALGYGYTWNGDVDLLADRSGTLYIMGGHSNIYEYINFTGHAAVPETITLSAFIYDTAAELLVNYGAVTPLAEGYSSAHYLTAAIDNGTGIIYSLFTCVDAENNSILLYYTFDTSTKSWNTEPSYVALPAIPTQEYAFVSDGLQLIYNADGIIYSMKNEIVTELASGILADVYAATDGTVHILYRQSEDEMYTYIFQDAVAATNIAASNPVSFTEKDGKLCLLAIEDATSVSIQVYYSENGVFTPSYTVSMDETVLPHGQLMAARSTNGSVSSDNFVFMFSGDADTACDWYFGVISGSAQ